MLKAIDKLLERYFQKSPDYNCLNRLESDVWRQIRQSKATAKSIAIMLPVWSNVNLRYASLSLAFILGVAMSQTYIQPSSNANTLGLEVFSPNVSFLITTNSEKLDLAII